MTFKMSYCAKSSHGTPCWFIDAYTNNRAYLEVACGVDQPDGMTRWTVDPDLSSEVSAEQVLNFIRGES